MTKRYALRDDQWERLQPLLPGRKGHVGVTARDNRLFVEAVLYRCRAGIPWRDLPERFGDWKHVHRRHLRWAQSGVWERVFQELSRLADNEYALIDSTIVRAHQHSAGGAQKKGRQAIGRSAAGLSTKLHALCDGQGQPTGFTLTPGQAHDLVGADVLLPQVQASAVRTLIADKAYDAQARVRTPLAQAGKVVVIPTKSPRTSPPKRQTKSRSSAPERTGRAVVYDKTVYALRHRIEQLFLKLKHYRGVATRYDKTAQSFLAGVYAVASLILLN